MPSMSTKYDHLISEGGLSSIDAFSTVEEEIPREPARRRPPKAPFHRIPTIILKLLILILSLWGLCSLLHLILLPSSQRTPRSCNCGASTTEALALSCAFDPLATAWLPPRCRDDPLTDLFTHAGPGPDGSWTYYADKHPTYVLTLTQVGLLADDRGSDGEDEPGKFYVSGTWHVAHCVFYWKKMFRARERGMVTEGRYMKASHIEQCARTFIRSGGGEDLDVIDTASVVVLESND
ncbi:MAG: hypothetical protein L6R39_005531 [Caloplaca ligustica]|nr:MAG: hypothetical protein L6R39_005531 [Caloplaca ligustica]